MFNIPKLTSKGDPLPHLQKDLVHYRTSKAYELKPSILNGAAIGYIGYDCVRYFEPRVATHYDHLRDPLQLPESVLLFCNSFIYLDYEQKTLQFVALCHISSNLSSDYQTAINRIEQLHSRLNGTVPSQSRTNVFRPTTQIHCPLAHLFFTASF